MVLAASILSAQVQVSWVGDLVLGCWQSSEEVKQRSSENAGGGSDYVLDVGCGGGDDGVLGDAATNVMDGYSNHFFDSNPHRKMC